MITVREGDREEPRNPSAMPVVMVLDCLRSAHNVGNIFRIADAVRAERIVACGYTAHPPHPKLEKTAMGADVVVPCEHSDTSAAALQALRAEGYRIYAVETAAGASLVWDAEITFPAAFVFGNEALGISRDALPLCDDFISLPAEGVKNSINVGNCAAVVMFDVWRRWQTAQDGCSIEQPIKVKE